MMLRPYKENVNETKKWAIVKNILRREIFLLDVAGGMKRCKFQTKSTAPVKNVQSK